MMHAQTYNGPAIALHWLVALLIVSAFPLGLYMTGLELSPTKLKLYSYHKWLGVTVLGLVAVRLIWRLVRGVPAAAPAPAWQQKTAALNHALLYVLMFAVPLTGWLMSSAKGFPVVYFGVLPLPDLVSKDEALSEWLLSVHAALNYVLAALVVLHAAAALTHHFIGRHRVLARMSPQAMPRKSNAGQ